MILLKFSMYKHSITKRFDNKTYKIYLLYLKSIIEKSFKEINQNSQHPKSGSKKRNLYTH